MKDHFGAAEIEFVLPLSGLRLSHRFHGFSTTSQMFEIAIPALLWVRPGAEGSEGCGLVDAWISDIVCGDGMAGEGVNRA